MTREDIAVNYKNNGFNCCQAVVKTLADLTNIDEDSLSKIASGFGAGMGCMEATCGALVGAIIISSIVSDKEKCMSTSREILNKFKELSGATACKDLKGKDTGVVLCKCDDCVKNAVQSFLEVTKKDLILK
jgi:C_GCAxxG_C_C family probable redox protein